MRTDDFHYSIEITGFDANGRYIGFARHNFARTTQRWELWRAGLTNPTSKLGEEPRPHARAGRCDKAEKILRDWGATDIEDSRKDAASRSLELMESA